MRGGWRLREKIGWNRQSAQNTNTTDTSNYGTKEVRSDKSRGNLRFTPILLPTLAKYIDFAKMERQSQKLYMNNATKLAVR
jgi:hypothetical protein